MSNVIIGIAGVILFIGLALAGATYLGSDFMTAKAQNDAVVIAQSASQYSGAAGIYRLRMRKPLANRRDNAADLIAAGILKAAPPNPILPGNAPFTINKDGGEGGGPPAYVIVELGYSTRARDACIEIERQAGHTERDSVAQMEQVTYFFDHAAPGKTGCHLNGGGYLAFYPA